MAAATPRRSWSRCQRSSASPTREAASCASTSSQLPGNWMTPNFKASAVGGDDLVVPDERVPRNLVEPRASGGGFPNVEPDGPADVHVRHAREPQRRQRPLHDLALRVE